MAILRSRAIRKPNAKYLPTKYTEGDKLSGYMSGVPHAEYKAAGAMSKYDIARFAKKGAFRFFGEEEKPQGRPVQINLALKALLFDAANFNSRYMLLPEVKDRRQSEYKAASKALGAENVFVGAEAQGITGMFEAIKFNDESRTAIESIGHERVAGFARDPDTDILLRTGVDKIVDNEAFVIKPVTSVAPLEIPKLMYNAAYHIEAAMILHVHHLISGDALDYVKFILVENTAPFQVAIVYLDDISLMVGRDELNIALSDYKKSLDNPEQVNNNQPSFMTSIPEFATREYDDFV